jgi:hypothetical protein
VVHLFTLSYIFGVVNRPLKENHAMIILLGKQRGIFSHRLESPLPFFQIVQIITLS